LLLVLLVIVGLVWSGSPGTTALSPPPLAELGVPAAEMGGAADERPRRAGAERQGGGHNQPRPSPPSAGELLQASGDQHAAAATRRLGLETRAVRGRAAVHEEHDTAS